MKSPVIFTLFVAAAYAQTNPLIPSGISSQCSTYLTKLDSDPQILSWTKAFTNVISNFGVGSTGSVSASAVNSALGNLCPSVPNFPESVIRGQLTDFYAACSNELTSSPNPDVLRAYDVLYALFPLSKAVCSKGDDGKYCVFEVGSSNSGSGQNSRRAEQQAIIPNLEQFKSKNLVFLGIQASLSTEQLCQPCTRNVLNEYIQFTSSLPYAPGIDNSPLMGGEADLYKAVQDKCGAPFLSGSLQAAGGINSGIMNGAADLSVGTRTVAGALSAIIAGFFVAL